MAGVDREAPHLGHGQAACRLGLAYVVGDEMQPVGRRRLRHQTVGEQRGQLGGSRRQGDDGVARRDVQPREKAAQ